MKPYKSDRERKSSVIQFRLNVADQQALSRISETTGLSYANLFRLRVLGDLIPPSKIKEEILIGIAQQKKISVLKVSDQEKDRMFREWTDEQIAKQTKLNADKTVKMMEKSVKKRKAS
jgi:hypothetical protein